MARIIAVGRAFPDHYCDQKTLIDAFKKHWQPRHHNLERLESLHRNVLVEGRHLALPLDAYEKLDSLTESNRAYIDVAAGLGERAAREVFAAARLEPQHIDHIFFVSSTGIATPSIDALLVNRLAMRPDVKRTPIFGLGCLAGAAGVARASDYLRGFPEQVALLVSVELCSLTLQRDDLSIQNIISSGLFGDGAAAVILVGGKRSERGPEVVASRSFFYPNTEYVMGWDVTSSGLRVVLSADVPRVVREHLRRNVDEFLSDCRIERSQIASYICHPGGPRVLEAFQESLDLTADRLALTWDSLRRMGNVSSASVLMVLRDALEAETPPPGSFGLMLAMGPGFCSEMVLLRW